MNNRKNNHKPRSRSNQKSNEKPFKLRLDRLDRDLVGEQAKLTWVETGKGNYLINFRHRRKKIRTYPLNQDVYSEYRSLGLHELIKEGVYLVFEEKDQKIQLSEYFDEILEEDIQKEVDKNYIKYTLKAARKSSTVFGFHKNGDVALYIPDEGFYSISKKHFKNHESIIAGQDLYISIVPSKKDSNKFIVHMIDEDSGELISTYPLGKKSEGEYIPKSSEKIDLDKIQNYEKLKEMNEKSVAKVVSGFNPIVKSKEQGDIPDEIWNFNPDVSIHSGETYRVDEKLLQGLEKANPETAKIGTKVWSRFGAPGVIVQPPAEKNKKVDGKSHSVKEPFNLQPGYVYVRYIRKEEKKNEKGVYRKRESFMATKIENLRIHQGKDNSKNATEGLTYQSEVA